MADKNWISKSGPYREGETVFDYLARKVAEEPVSEAMLNAPMALAWRKKSKMSFYRINADGTTHQVYVAEDSGNESG